MSEENFEIIPYTPLHKDIIIDLRFDKIDNFYLNEQQLSELYNVTRQNVNLHLNNAFKSGELDENSVCKEYLHTAKDNKKYKTKFYNFDAILHVGYRVNSKEGIAFRQTATQIIKNHINKTINIKLIEQTNKIDSLENSIEDLLDRQTLSTYQANQLNKTGRARVVHLLDGKSSKKYKEHSKLYFANLWNNFNDYFEIGTYRELNPREYKEGLNYINNWEHPI
jgi:hypothetical protein